MLPPIYKPLWKEEARYYFLRGGRGSGKSWAVADYLLMKLLNNPRQDVVCLREVQKSIENSSKKLLSDRINKLGIGKYFEVLSSVIWVIEYEVDASGIIMLDENKKEIKKRQGRIIFNGLQDHTVDTIKSLEGFNFFWVEEAQTITEYSLDLLTPTMRANGGKLIFTYNPKNETDAIETLIKEKDNKVVIHSNYTDNPYVPESIVEEAKEMQMKRPLKYNHIYLGQFGEADGLVFENVEVRVIREDEVRGLECLQGLDFGYTNDPSAFCINYIDEEEKIFYVFDGFYKKGLLNSQIADEIKRLHAHKHTIYADSAEPKSIDTLKLDGVTRIRGAIKGKDSINAGIDFLLDYHIVINSHLKDFINEAHNYTWAVDKKTNKPTNKPIDDNNHFWDSCRYSCSNKIQTIGKTKSFKIGLI